MTRRLVGAMLALAVIPWVLRAQQAPGPAGEEALAAADARMADGRYADARQAYRALVTVPGDAGSRAAAGAVLAGLRIGDFAAALADAASYRAARPDDPRILAVHGDALWTSGLFDEAASAYDRALGLDPAEPRARNGRARLLSATSRLDEALAEAQAAQRLAPDEPEFHGTAGSILQRLNRFQEAAAEFRTFVRLLPRRDRTSRSLWARENIRFLDAFGRRRPYDFGSAPASQTWTVPVRIEGDKTYVSGKVNGARLDFVLDTGAEQTVLSRDLARRAGVVPITYIETAGVGAIGFRGLQVGRIDTLEIGPLKVRNVPSLIKNPPLRDVPQREPESFSPIALGLSMRLDYARRELTMGRELPAVTGAVQMPLRMYRLATVRGTINGAPASFVVDTGGEVISISGSTADRIHQEPALRRIPIKVYGTSGWDRDAFLMPGVSLAFSSIRLESTPVVVLDLSAPSALLGYQLGGIVGHKFLSKYRVTLDLQRSLLVLE